MTAEFTNANALSTLLTTEGLLFAALALAVNLLTPSRRPPKLPVPAKLIGYFAAGVLVVVAIGAAFAWGQIYTGGHLRDFSSVVEAGSMLVAIAAQPVLAVLLALGLRTED